MTGSIALDVVISLVFIYLLYSLMATIVQEIIATYFLKLRAKVLEEAIQRMLDDDAGGKLLSKVFYDTPIIKYMAQEKGKKPSYLTARNFSKALLDILKGPNPKPGEDFRNRIDSALDDKVGITISSRQPIQSGETFAFLQTLWADAHGDIERFRISLEKWFDDTMERASGWYKKKTQLCLLIVGFVIAVIFNIDTILIVQKLSRDPKLTAQLVSQAENFVKQHPNLDLELKQQQEEMRKLIDKKDSAQAADSVRRNYEFLKAHQKKQFDQADSLLREDIKNVNGLLGLGIHTIVRGKSCWEKIGFFLLSVFGWSITALALSLGAPFWFDLLNKLMNLRSSIATVKTDDSEKGKSESNSVVINPKG